MSVIAYVSCTTGVNCSIFGYMSSGESVPDVITTLLNRSNTGLIAIAGSRHLSPPARQPVKPSTSASTSTSAPRHESGARAWGHASVARRR